MKYPARDIAPYAAHVFFCCMRQAYATALTRLYASWWGIELGKSSRFYGIPLLRRHPTGKIIIGNHVTLRSAEWSNSIGINRRCFIAAGHNAKIRIGNDCGFSGTVIVASASITIGSRVLCGGNCTIVDTDRHPLDPIARASHEPGANSPVTIEDDVFLGMNVVVLKGCVIGKGTVVAANSVVTQSLPEGVLAGGVPARVIQQLPCAKQEAYFAN